MNKPCEYCSKADKKRADYFKCDKPCRNAKQCYENDKKLLEIFRGFFPPANQYFLENRREGNKMECVNCDYYKAHNCMHQCMQLPEGKTCADCAHIDQCMMMFHGKPESTMCGWEPVRFKEISCSWNDRQKQGCEEWCGLPLC